MALAWWPDAAARVDGGDVSLDEVRPIPRSGVDARPRQVEACYARRPGRVSRRLRSRVLVRDPDGRVRVLEGAVAVVWSVLEGRATAAQLADRIDADRPVGPGTPVDPRSTDRAGIRREVDRALGALLDDGLVVAGP